MDRQVDIAVAAAVAVAQPKTRRVVVVVVVAAAYKFRKLFEGTFIYLFFRRCVLKLLGLAWLRLSVRFGFRSMDAPHFECEMSSGNTGRRLGTCHMPLGTVWTGLT